MSKSRKSKPKTVSNTIPPKAMTPPVVMPEPWYKRYAILLTIAAALISAGVTWFANDFNRRTQERNLWKQQRPFLEIIKIGFKTQFYPHFTVKNSGKTTAFEPKSVHRIEMGYLRTDKAVEFRRVTEKQSGILWWKSIPVGDIQGSSLPRPSIEAISKVAAQLQQSSDEKEIRVVRHRFQITYSDAAKNSYNLGSCMDEFVDRPGQVICTEPGTNTSN